MNRQDKAKLKEALNQNLHLVYNDGKIKMYESESAAYYAALQNGGVAFTHYITDYNTSLITVDKMKRMRAWDNKYGKINPRR